MYTGNNVFSNRELGPLATLDTLSGGKGQETVAALQVTGEVHGDGR